MKRSILLFILLFQSAAFCALWQKIKIPDAVCGLGQDYSIYYQKKNAQKLIFEFMGGGACWDGQSCLGLKKSTILSSIGPIVSERLSSSWSSNNHLEEHSYIFLPYCTGDVFAGDHVAEYDVHHKGAANVRAVLQYLTQKEIVKWEQVEDFVLTGSSAGALASLMHAQKFETYLPSGSRKTIIADAPGLHFGLHFWQKFSEPLLQDYQKLLTPLGLSVNLEDGNLAPYMGQACQVLSHWEVALLQGTRDLVMSEVFGEISPSDHEKLVLGPQGIIESTKNSPNCHTWVAKTYSHTFLLGVTLERVDGVSAKEFAYSVINRQVQ